MAERWRTPATGRAAEAALEGRLTVGHIVDMALEASTPSSVTGVDPRMTAIYVDLPLNAMRCPVCGHRLDDMDGCDSCEADKDEAIRQASEGDGDDD